MKSFTSDNTEEHVPATPAELSRLLAENAATDRRPLLPAGGRTSLQFGYDPVSGSVPVSTTQLSRVVDYPARDMTITVQAGIRIEKLAATLAAERQQLAVDVPQAHRATLGGVAACNVSGPRRIGLGTMRDYVIGISAVDGQGRLFKAGGRVVKNVAGYDLCKLLVGSMGTLAIITELTLKLRPIPESSALLWASLPDIQTADRAIERLLTSATRPHLIELLKSVAARHIDSAVHADLSCHDGGICIGIGVEGGPREVSWQLATLKDELIEFGPTDLVEILDDDCQPVITALTEFSTASEEPLTFQAGVRPSGLSAFWTEAAARGISLQAHAANGVVLGHFPDELATLEHAQTTLEDLRRLAAKWDGCVTVLQCPPEWKAELSLFGPAGGQRQWESKIKQSFDPHHLLNPGRFFVEPAARTH